MNELLPEKYNNNPFKNFYRKIKSFFYKKSNDKFNIEEQNIQTTLNDNSDKLQYLKVTNVPDYLNPSKQDEFVEELINNPKLVDSLPLAKLEELLKIITEKNEQKEMILSKLSSQV